MMYDNFKAVSLSYKNTPLDIRELLALSPDMCRILSLKIADLEGISDILVLSTCNRTEVYYNAPIDYSFNIINEIFELNQVDKHVHHQDYFQVINESQAAVLHLFYVSMGLESQVVGDMQISNQVKQAYQLSADLNLAGPFLHRLMHTIFFTNKRVSQETPFRSGAASSSYATVELIEDFAEDIYQPKVLVLGIGEIGSDVCRNLKDSFIEDIAIMNRTYAKAEALAEECNARAVPFELLEQALQEADIIVSSVSRKDFIQKTTVERLEILSFKYFIDLSVPRSIEPEVEDVSGVLLYNIDQINNKANDALQKRLASVPDVKAIIHQSIDDLQEWAKEMEVSPTIQKLKNALEQIRKEEIDRYRRKLSEQESEHIEQITRNMMQKIIKLPALQLKAACKRGEAETLIDVLNDLFNLENQPEKIVK